MRHKEGTHCQGHGSLVFQISETVMAKMNVSPFVEQEITLTRTERQLLLFGILWQYEAASLASITRHLPVSSRTIQRDIVDLTDAGLVCMEYSRKKQGYVWAGTPEFKEDATGRRRAHLKRLNRLGRLMTEMENEDIPLWRKILQEKGLGIARRRHTSKDSYYEICPDSSERTRQRDFETLRRIGFIVYYDNQNHCFEQWGFPDFSGDLRVRRVDGRLIRRL